MAHMVHTTLSAAATIANGAAIAAMRNAGGFTSAIIASAGNSTRMGGKISKQFLEVAKVPVLARTLSAFCNTALIHEIVVVARKEDFPAIREIWARTGSTLPFSLAEGGETRALSVQNGFAKISPNAKYVAIHDGARCLITPADIEKVCRAAYRYKAASAAHRVSDSVKIANRRGYIEKSVDRNTVWLVQTPQVFDTNLYRAALATAKDTVHITDDNSLMEQVRYPVKLVECAQTNMKITLPGDIAKAEEILRERGECL